MEYQSTRNNMLRASSAQAVLDGLAPDGGLYSMPSLRDISFDSQSVLKLDTQGMATEILTALLPSFSKDEMRELVKKLIRGSLSLKT